METIWGTYNNYDKDEDSDGIEDCDVVFQWGDYFEPTAVEEFASGSGVHFTDNYAGSGDMTWTLTFTVSDCNGTFPAMVFEGGKAN